MRGVEAVLAKAIYLRLKISNCMHKATNNKYDKEIEGFEGGAVANGDKNETPDGRLTSEAEKKEDEEEAERLLHIQDAPESLEHQLSNLQVLQQQQRFEKEVAFGEIEHSRKMLLDKLKGYKGDDLEVIQEASAFVGEAVEHNSDLFLPPYPIRPQLSVRDNQYVSHINSVRKFVPNGVISGEAMKELNDPVPQTIPESTSKGLGHIIGAAAKTVVTLVGVISVLSLSGFGANIGKNKTSFEILSLSQQPSAEGREQSVKCPPGRALVLENGEARCIVKERVAIPFDLAFARLDVNYGSG